MRRKKLTQREGAKEQDSPAAEDREGQEEKGEGNADRDRV